MKRNVGVGGGGVIKQTLKGETKKKDFKKVEMLGLAISISKTKLAFPTKAGH